MFKVYPRNMKDMEHFPQRERMEWIDIANNIGQIISAIKFRTNIEDLYLKAKGGVRGQKTSFAYIKVEPVIELLLFSESQNLLIPIQNIGR